MPINTLEASKRLKELGFDEDQSEGLAQLLSELDVASATKEDLEDLEERLTSRIDRVGERVGSLETDVEDKVPTKAELEATEEHLGKKIEENHSSTVRTVVGSSAAVCAFLAVVTSLVIYMVG